MTQKGDILTVSHSEWFHTQYDHAVFAPQGFYCQPGLSGSFPWLAAFANCFENYRFRSLRYHYIPRAPSTVSGSVGLFFDYDPLDIAPTLASFALSNKTSVINHPSKEFYLNVDCNRLGQAPIHFTRPIEVGNGADLKTYDIGRVFSYAQGGPNSGLVWGELLVEYTIDLINPQPCENTGSGSLRSGGGGVTPTSVFGATPSIASTVPVAVNVSDVAQVIFKEGFEGLLNSKAIGTNLAGTANLGASADVIFSIMDSIKSSDNTNVFSSWKITAPKGSSLKPVQAGDTLTSFHMDFARGLYNMFTA